MGLLAEKQSRSRINKDPNNTKWTRDTKTFGQKILRAQGWQPGQFLGVQDAAHSELHTAANASYIRVALKDDMKGLGYNRAKEDQVTGLDVFSDLLSRLNGKSEDSIEDDKQARLVVKTNRYVEAKWGPMRFIRGGLLVGDEMQTESASDDSGETSNADDDDDAPKQSKKDNKSKKRKAADLDESEADSSSADAERKKEKKRRKEERKAKKLAAAATETEDNTAGEEGRSRKRSKKNKDKSKSKTGSDVDEESAGSKKSKNEKKDKKDKKDKKRRKDEEAAGPADVAAASEATSAVATGTSTPTETGTGTSTPRGSRNFVRSRFIAQKRQAVLDTKALAQIFMVKT